VILIGRLVRDPEIRSNAAGEKVAASYTLAVNRSFKNKEGKIEADFIRCVAFGGSATFVEKYLHKGMAIGIVGRIQTGSYEDKDGKKVYTTDIIVSEHEFVERKSTNNSSPEPSSAKAPDDGFMQIPDDAEEELPF